MRRGFVIGSLMIVLAGWSAPARADFVISIGSTSIAQGSTGTIDVMLSSNAPSTAPDLLNNVGFELQISSSPSQPGILQFATQDFSYLNNTNYVFFGDSIDYQTSSPGGSVSTSFTPNDTFTGSDSTASGNPFSLDSTNTPVLLAVLTFDTSITNVGDSYTISLMPPSGTGSNAGGANTFFDYFDFNNTGTELSAVPFTSTSGTVTITGSVVPEPASIVMGLSAVALLAGAGLYRGRRRSKRQPA